jgi:hypothetical protein
MIVNGPDATGATSTKVEDQIYTQADNIGPDYFLDLNTSVMKAIGYDPEYQDRLSLDGSVTFSSLFQSDFDFDPTDGIAAGKIDFLAVALHEIGHALGFVSGVDLYDVVGGPNGPLYAEGIDMNDYAALSALDMFRYSDDPNHLGPGGPVLDETVGTPAYFSIDGGQTALFGNTFSTGAFNGIGGTVDGAGNQASHWADSPTCNGALQLGMMDPNVCGGQMGVVKALDLAAFDAIGWNLSVDALAGNGSYSKTTGAIFSEYSDTSGISLSAAPEPASWALMLGGFGLVGAALRRRQRTAISFG